MSPDCGPARALEMKNKYGDFKTLDQSFCQSLRFSPSPSFFLSLSLLSGLFSQVTRAEPHSGPERRNPGLHSVSLHIHHGQPRDFTAMTPSQGGTQPGRWSSLAEFQ